MEKKFIAILKKIPWYYFGMFFLCNILFHHVAPINGVVLDDNACAAGIAGYAFWFLFHGFIFFVKRLLGDKHSPAQEVSE